MTRPGADEELMLRYRDGDTGAFEQLYARHKGPVYRYIRRQCGNVAVAEELFQDVWMSVIKTRERYTVSAKFSTYLYRIARNRLVDHHRAEARVSARIEPDVEVDEQTGAEQPDPVRKLDTARALERLDRALQGLPATQREVFLLREEGGLSIDDIGQLTGVGRETAKSRLRYALAKLRRVLQENR